MTDSLAMASSAPIEPESRDPDQIPDVWERINRHRGVFEKAQIEDRMPLMLGRTIMDVLEGLTELHINVRQIIGILNSQHNSDSSALAAVEGLTSRFDRLNKKVSVLLANQVDDGK